MLTSIAMKFSTSTVLVVAATASTVSAQTDYKSYVKSYLSHYSTDPAWLNYLKTRSFTTPAVLESWMNHYSTITDTAEISNAVKNFPSEAFYDYYSQYFPTDLITSAGPSDSAEITSAVVHYSAENTSALVHYSAENTSVASNVLVKNTSVSQGAAMNTMVPYAAVVGLSGVVAGLVFY